MLHGNYKPECVGINKDRNIPPGNADHVMARKLAELATKDYVEQILAAIAGNDKAIAALMDVGGTVGFVIDDTGSMGPEIQGIKNTVALIVNEINQDPTLKPDNWLLVRFGDPDVGSAFVTENATELLNAVNMLSARGGGDCPELSQAALLEAIDKSFRGSRLYFYSDASAKDSTLRNTVISRAQEKSIKLIYGLTGSCSPIDQAYIRGAEETGGQLFLVSQFEVPRLFDLIKPGLSGDLATIISARGLLIPSRRLKLRSHHMTFLTPHSVWHKIKLRELSPDLMKKIMATP